MISFSSDQKFIVTGASSGIGKSIALLLNELGASVVAIGRNLDRLNDLKRRAKTPESIFLEQKDLTEDVENLTIYVKSLKERYGKFSGLAYCAGVTDVTPFKCLDMENVESIFKIDYYSPLFFVKGFLDKRNNIGKGTSVVLLSSFAGSIAIKGMVAYCGAKAALINSSKVIAKEYALAGLRINTVSPSDIETPMTQTGEIKNFVEDRLSQYPFGVGKPEDVANMVIFLLSDKAKWITGQDYVIDCASY